MYNIVEQETQNSKVFVSGIIEYSPIYDHEVYGEAFYKFHLSVVRQSGVKDTLPVLISERLMCNCNIEELNNHYAEIFGEIRTVNKVIDGHGKLEVYIFAFGLNLDEEDYEQGENKNSVWLRGVICKTPMYRTTPFGRQITDLMLAVNRKYGKSSYVPCITWGRAAYFAANLNVGDYVEVSGRFQSREYIKRFSPDSEYGETRTAYEISVARINQISQS